MIAVAFLRGNAWIEIPRMGCILFLQTVAFLRGNAWIEIIFLLVNDCFSTSHSCEGMRGLKYLFHCVFCRRRHVAFLRGSAWIEMVRQIRIMKAIEVAFLRGSAWIEIQGFTS